MKNIPTKLYLQTGLKINNDECDDFNELCISEISHSFEKIYSDDIEYILLEPIQHKLNLVNFMLYGAESSFKNGEITSAGEIEQTINDLMMKCIDYDKANKTI